MIAFRFYGYKVNQHLFPLCDPGIAVPCHRPHPARRMAAYAL